MILTSKETGILFFLRKKKTKQNVHNIFATHDVYFKSKKSFQIDTRDSHLMFEKSTTLDAFNIFPTPAILK